MFLRPERLPFRRRLDRLHFDYHCDGADLSDSTRIEMSDLNLAINAQDTMANRGVS
jgi:hypothetical protein